MNKYTLNKLYNYLNKYPYSENGGIYKNGYFYIIPNISYVDKNGRAGISAIKIVSRVVNGYTSWHSHPFDQDYVGYPSREDLHMVKKYKLKKHIIICKYGIYIIRNLDKLNIDKFYDSILYENEYLNEKSFRDTSLGSIRFHYVNQNLFSNLNSRYIKFIDINEL